MSRAGSLYHNALTFRLKHKKLEQYTKGVGWGPLDRYGNDGSPLYDTNIYLNVLYKIITTFV